MTQKTISADNSLLNQNLDELQKINNLRKANEQKKKMIDDISAKIDNLDSSILNLNIDIELYEKRSKEYPNRIEKLKKENDSLLAQVNKNKQEIKSVKTDKDSTLLLIDTLMEEYEALNYDKTDLTKRITTLHKVIEDLNIERKQKLPKLKKYDAMLKKALYELQDTENCMDISLKLWQRKSNYNPVNE